MQMHIPLLEVQITPKTSKPHFCYRMKCLGSTENFPREKKNTLEMLRADFGAEIKDGKFILHQTDFQESLENFPIITPGSYTASNDPYFNPVLVMAPEAICYDSYEQMFEDLFNYTDTVKGEVVGMYKFKL